MSLFLFEQPKLKIGTSSQRAFPGKDFMKAKVGTLSFAGRQQLY